MVSAIISELMIEHHIKIEKLFNKFKRNIKESGVSEIFNKFKWELEKHLFVEEKAIFTFYNPKNKEDYRVVPYVLEEHNLILDFLKEIEDNLKNKKEVDISKFEKLLKEHKNFEDVSFYPKLDKNLTDSQKEQIVSRIKEIVR